MRVHGPGGAWRRRFTGRGSGRPERGKWRFRNMKFEFPRVHDDADATERGVGGQGRARRAGFGGPRLFPSPPILEGCGVTTVVIVVDTQNRRRTQSVCGGHVCSRFRGHDVGGGGTHPWAHPSGGVAARESQACLVSESVSLEVIVRRRASCPGWKEAMDGGGDGCRGVLSSAEKTAVAAAVLAVVIRSQIERTPGTTKARLSARRQRLLVQRVVDAPDCIRTSEAVFQLRATVGCGVVPPATPRWWMKRSTGGTWEDLRVCDDASEDYFRKSFACLAVMVDLNLRILDLFVGYPGSCHDIRIMQLSSLSRRVEDGTLFRGPPVTLSGGVRINGYILGDNGYPPSEWVVVP
ncbi:hypothetical protein CBR_g27982 [Chara braunii]|uniref:DDE Tnp4 domain-containing protein n=1 Tax=Chara braunii TaxID=69332 RepID=A0A388L901_CHABU|nr:hypothetical protein CBR_g27982 [Chara braunii]|eukprot:GBG78758.1 hypothetical protein CBR_g27982 [Chara braunii]